MSFTDLSSANVSGVLVNGVTWYNSVCPDGTIHMIMDGRILVKTISEIA